jgi:hypothetical protein
MDSLINKNIHCRLSCSHNSIFNDHALGTIKLDDSVQSACKKICIEIYLKCI